MRITGADFKMSALFWYSICIEALFSMRIWVGRGESLPRERSRMQGFRGLTISRIVIDRPGRRRGCYRRHHGTTTHTSAGWRLQSLSDISFILIRVLRCCCLLYGIILYIKIWLSPKSAWEIDIGQGWQMRHHQARRWKSKQSLAIAAPSTMPTRYILITSYSGVSRTAPGQINDVSGQSVAAADALCWDEK